jgi:uncharacterized protein
MSIRRLIPLLLVGLVLLLTGGPAVEAQDGDALRFFQQNPTRPLFRSQPQPARAQPQARRAPREEPEERYVAPRRRTAPEGETPVASAPERPVVPVTTFVHVIGDSLGELLAQGLKEQLADSKPDVGVVKRARSSSGIVRDDYYDWSKALKELLGGAEKVDMVVMMLGSNDRQQLRDETGPHDFGADRWREIYVKRLDDLMALAREKRVPFVIVGMPVMQSQRLSADMLVLNAIFRERASRNGGAYVDIWEGFASEQGQYAFSGPDVNGEIVRLRTGDGIHFTKAGLRKLGFFVGKEVDQQLGKERPGVDIAALPSDLSEQIKRDSPGLAPQGLQAALPLPAEMPALPVISVRPLAGPTIALTGAPQTVGGQMLRGRFNPPANEMTILVEQAFGYGRLPPAKPGRADDYSWPRAQARSQQGQAN